MINKLYTYIITVDNGMSPCYHNGLYSLACCKPQIRRMIYSNYLNDIKSNNANIWIMGIRRDKQNGKGPFIVYLAKITNVLKLEEYYSDESIYTGRDDCNYRGVKTVDELPISIKKSDGYLEKYFPDISAKKKNEHGEFRNIKSLYKLTSQKYEAVHKDICGKAVLISDKFVHCSQVNVKDKYALTKLLPCFNELLKDYKQKNRRCYHSFDNWEMFFDTVENISFNSKNTVIPLDDKSSNCVGCSKKTKCF